jgi:putative ABC transport system permease protein
VYGVAIGSIITVMWWQSGNLQLTLMVLLGTLVCVLALYIISSLLFRSCQALIPLLNGPWKVGLQQLIRHKQRNQLQLLALGLSMMVLMLIFLIRNDLIIRWQQQLPEQAPNHFIINIQSDEVPGIRRFLAEKNVNTEGLFPMVRGRIEKINGVPIKETVADNAQLDNALRRELNLSWNDQLQQNNSLVEGQWWAKDQIGKPYISIEDGLAQRLGVGIGDSITFKIVDEEISASILNIRSVQWDSFQPNFYVIFSPDIINDYPVTYISSFYLPKAEKQTLNDLVRAYPTVTVLEIDDIMNQVKAIMQQVSTTIGYVMLFVLFAGLVVLAAALQSTIDQRMHAATIMRTLGASKAFLSRTQFSEFIILGYLSGLLAVIATESVAYGLYTRVFHLDFELHLSLWLYGPLLSSALIYAISRFYMRKVTRLSPVRILREA